MGKRVVAVFCVYAVLLLAIIGWIMHITFSEKYIAAGSRQSSYTLTVTKSRGKIYDRNMNVLAGGAWKYTAVVEPSAETAARLINSDSVDESVDLAEKFKSSRPFLLNVKDGSLSGDGIRVFRVAKRYAGLQSIAPHLVGYVNSEGGVTGIEMAYNDTLESYSGELKIKYTVNAMGASLKTDPVVTDTTALSTGGVVLTLDSRIQLIAQQALESNISSGAAVVMDCKTGEILALASYPQFDQNNISDFLNGENSPLLNKAVSSYDVGSVFKLVVAAAAIESGREDFACFCDGCAVVGDKKFYCSSKKGHGNVDMEKAIALSCNKYFILLGQETGKEKLLEQARKMGFGSSIELGEGYYTSEGNLPHKSELELPAGLANFSFGQGSLMANPVQLAAAVCCIANGGEYVVPKVVEYTVDSYGNKAADWNTTAPRRVMKKRTARILTDCMKSTMSIGTGKNLSISIPSAGKTGSAQTGMIKNGKRVTQGWFAGFFPSDEPRYVCVVLAENGESGAKSAGPVFAAIANAMEGQ